MSGREGDDHRVVGSDESREMLAMDKLITVLRTESCHVG